MIAPDALGLVSLVALHATRTLFRAQWIRRESHPSSPLSQAVVGVLLLAHFVSPRDIWQVAAFAL